MVQENFMGLRHLSVQSKMETPCRYLDHSGQLCRQYWRFSLKNPSSCLFFPSGLCFPCDSPVGEENNTDKCGQTIHGAWRVWKSQHLCITPKLTFLEESLTLEALEMEMGKTSLLW